MIELSAARLGSVSKDRLRGGGCRQQAEQRPNKLGVAPFWGRGLLELLASAGYAGAPRRPGFIRGKRLKRVTKGGISGCRSGSRFLPATKASPKENEMPIVDKPLIQYAVKRPWRLA